MRLTRARVVRRLSYCNGLAALNLSISARGAMPSSFLGMEAAAGFERVCVCVCVAKVCWK